MASATSTIATARIARRTSVPYLVRCKANEETREPFVYFPHLVVDPVTFVRTNCSLYMLRRMLSALLSLCLPAISHAQWSIIASRLASAPRQPGVMYFKDGVLWAGGYDLFKSTD